MSATITFTDSIGTATLSNIPEIPVERFDGWTPDVNSVGDEAFALGTGQLYKFEYRVDDLVSFRIANLKGDQLTYARRLKLHLLRGGEVTVDATNELNELYTTCTLAPDTRPTISEPNADREYTFSVTLRAGEGVPDSGSVGSAEDEFGIVPGLILDWDAEAEAVAGHEDGELLPLIADQSGEGNHGTPPSSFKPVLKTAQLNGRAIFDLTGNKAAGTSTKLLRLTDDATIVQVRRYVGVHIEHGVLLKFDTSASVGGGDVIAVQESSSVAPGSQDDRAAQFGGFYIDADGTVWHVLVTRVTGHTVEMFYNEVLQEVFNGTTGASVGMGVGYAGGWNGESLAYFTMGNGVTGGGNGLNAEVARNLIWGRSLSDTEVTAVSSRLRVVFGI